MYTLPPELQKEVTKYRRAQGDIAPTGAVPAYPGTYLEYLQGMYDLRRDIQLYATSCGGAMKDVQVTPTKWNINLYGKALDPRGVSYEFSIAIDKKDIPRIIEELEGVAQGMRHHVAISYVEGGTIIRRLAPGVGIILGRQWQDFATPTMLAYCRELVEAILGRT